MRGHFAPPILPANRATPPSMAARFAAPPWQPSSQAGSFISVKPPRERKYLRGVIGRLQTPNCKGEKHMHTCISRAVASVSYVALALALLMPSLAWAQAAAKSKPPETGIAEQRTARALDAVRANPLELRAFLLHMPKGADLHNHLAGAVYAEGWIRAGAEDNLCVDLATLAFFKTQAMTRSIPPQPVCGEGKTAAAQAFKDQRLYDSLVNAFSMRSF